MKKIKEGYDLAAWSKRLAEKFSKRDPKDNEVVDTFSITRRQMKLINKFNAKEDKKYAKKQGQDYPYYGAIGGGLTYSFSPTGIGIVLKVVHATGAILDVTDYDMW